jgi:hypothetical protein
MLGVTCEYRSTVGPTVECPSFSEAILGWIPWASISDAAVCRTSLAERVREHEVVGLPRATAVETMLGLHRSVVAWGFGAELAEHDEPARASGLGLDDLPCLARDVLQRADDAQFAPVDIDIRRGL